MAPSHPPPAANAQTQRAAHDWWPLVPAALLIALAISGLASANVHALEAWMLVSLRPAADPAQLLGPPWLQVAMRDFTALGGTAVLVLWTVVIFGALLVARRKRDAWWFVLGVISALGISSTLKTFINRPRPEVVPHETWVHTASFPSGHALMATVVWLLIAQVVADASDRRGMRVYAVAVALVFAALAGFSRLYLGVHWPTDVLAGWGIGIAWVWLVRRARRG